MMSDWIQGTVGGATIALTFLLWRVANRQAKIYERQAELMAGALKAAEDTASAGVISANAAKAAVDHSRQSAQIELRAYIGLDDTKLKNVAAGKKPAMLLQFKNSGRTPAKKVQLWARFKYDSVPEQLPRGSSTPSSSSTISPEAIFSLPDEMKNALTSQDVALIKSGRAAIYIYGEVTYEDVFGHPHRTLFNLVHTKSTPTSTLTVCADGNESD